MYNIINLTLTWGGVKTSKKVHMIHTKNIAMIWHLMQVGNFVTFILIHQLIYILNIFIYRNWTTRCCFRACWNNSTPGSGNTSWPFSECICIIYTHTHIQRREEFTVNINLELKAVIYLWTSLLHKKYSKEHFYPQVQLWYNTGDL